MSTADPISLDEVRSFVKSGYIKSTILHVARNDSFVLVRCLFYLKSGEAFTLVTSRGHEKTFKTFDAACNFMHKLCIPNYSVHEGSYYDLFEVAANER